METFREDLAAMGYKFQYALAGFHALNTSMFELSKGTKNEEWQAILNYKKENLLCQQHFKAVKHQGFVGTSYLMQFKIL
jgi:isocitrate lyase